MNMVGSDEFCIPREMLYKYGVSSDVSNSNNVLLLLKQNEFEEESDYITAHINMRGSW